MSQLASLVLKDRRKLSLVIFFVLLKTTILAQSITPTNIHYRTIDNKIEIFYDLPQNTDTLIVSVAFYKTSNPKFSYQPKFTKGKVGTGVFSGKSQKIAWYFKKEPKWIFTGSGFYFEISARKLTH